MLPRIFADIASEASDAVVAAIFACIHDTNPSCSVRCTAASGMLDIVSIACRIKSLSKTSLVEPWIEEKRENM